MPKLNFILPLSSRSLLLSFILALVLMQVAGCRSDGTSILSPYKVEIVQGNFFSKEQVALIQPGMTRNQVQTILGSPLLIDVFHDDRWDYSFYIKRRGVLPLQRQITVYFDGNVVSKLDAPQDLLTEEEFVLYLEGGEPDENIKTPVLAASPEQLERAQRNVQAYREREDIRSAEQSDSAQPLGYYPPLD